MARTFTSLKDLLFRDGHCQLCEAEDLNILTYPPTPSASSERIKSERGSGRSGRKEEILDGERNTKIHRLSACLQGCSLMLPIWYYYHLLLHLFPFLIWRNVVHLETG